MDFEVWFGAADGEPKGLASIQAGRFNQFGGSGQSFSGCIGYKRR